MTIARRVLYQEMSILYDNNPNFRVFLILHVETRIPGYLLLDLLF